MPLAQRLDHVGITVQDLGAALTFFQTLGMEPDDEPRVVAGHWLEEVIGIDDARVEVVMLRMPGDGTSLELSRFHHPVHDDGPRAAPANELGLRTIAFEVADLRAAVERLQEDGFGLVRAIVTYDDLYTLAYVRGPEGIIVMLAESLA